MTLIQDTEALAEKFGGGLTHERLAFRLDLLQEEVQECREAFLGASGEDLVDGLVDVVVVALTTLEMAGVSIDEAWSEVFLANMTKVVGTKEGRESPDGFDLMKPEGWKGPDHSGNVGCLDEIL